MRIHALVAAGAVAASSALLAGTAYASTVNFTLGPQNGSGASAQATVVAMPDGSLEIEIHGTGFTPDLPHAQHLHGAPEGGFFCPTPSADRNGDGQVSTEEGVAQYGAVMVSLTTKGDTSAGSGLAVDRMPVADGDGNLDYRRTIPASGVPEGVAENVDNLHIVQHGLDVNGNDTYDMDALGESVFAQSMGVSGIPEEATNPATCGEVAARGAVETGSGGTAGLESAGLLGLGGAALVGAGGISLLLRRGTPVRARSRVR